MIVISANLKKMNLGDLELMLMWNKLRLKYVSLNTGSCKYLRKVPWMVENKSVSQYVEVKCYMRARKEG